MDNVTLTALKGVKVGHSTHLDKLTGTTVVLFDNHFPIAYKTYGGSPGTYNTDAFRNGKSDFRGHAIFISGGSWTGLRSGGEIVTKLIEDKKGFPAFKIFNPNITGAIVFDLGTRIELFNPKYAREAYDNASYEPVKRGNVGAGTGTSVGKFQYMNKGKLFSGMKTGLGCARINLDGRVIVSALTVLNALGNVVSPEGKIIAGNRSNIRGEKFRTFSDFSQFLTKEKSNTTISIVGLNVDLRLRENYERVAHLATQGQTRAIDPVNTSLDGDTVFVFSNEEIKKPLNPSGGQIARGSNWNNLDVDVIGQAAAKAVQKSIYDACYQAESIKFDALDGIVPSAKDYK